MTWTKDGSDPVFICEFVYSAGRNRWGFEIDGNEFFWCLSDFDTGLWKVSFFDTPGLALYTSTTTICSPLLIDDSLYNSLVVA